MSQTATQPVTDLVDKAIKSYEQALKSSMKVQEEATKWMTDAFGETGMPSDVQKKMTAVATDAIPAARQNLEEALQLVEENSKTTLDLLEQVYDSMSVDTLSGAQTKTKELWEASLKTVRANAEATVKANAKAMESWTEYAKKSAQCVTPG